MDTKEELIGSRPRSADDAAQCSRGRRSADRVAQGWPPPGRARSRRACEPLRRRGHRSRMGERSSVPGAEEPQGRHLGERLPVTDQTLRSSYSSSCRVKALANQLEPSDPVVRFARPVGRAARGPDDAARSPRRPYRSLGSRSGSTRADRANRERSRRHIAGPSRRGRARPRGCTPYTTR